MANYRVVKKPMPNGVMYEVQRKQGRGWSVYAKSENIDKAIDCAKALVDGGERVVWHG